VAGAAYAVGDFTDPAAEVERLRRQAEVAVAEESAFRQIGMPTEGLVLDLGCGPGFAATRMRGLHPGQRWIGVDRDPGLLALARATLSPAVADVAALPFAGARFDFVHARLVLRHLARPEAALREVLRVLRPGGRVGVLDTDDDALVLDPAPDGFAAVLAARQRTFIRRGADPFVGRRLPALLRAGGFVDIQVATLPLTSFAIGARAFASIVLAPVADAIDADLCPRPQVEAAAQALRAWGERSDAFGMTTALVVGGCRPESADGSL
jgi:SAM-dependent methyltransferase